MLSLASNPVRMKKVFGNSWLFFLVIWVLCFLALGTTQSNCLYEEDRRDTDGLMNQDGDVMDGTYEL